jgi:hypothetical protein
MFRSVRLTRPCLAWLAAKRARVATSRRVQALRQLANVSRSTATGGLAVKVGVS